VPTGDSTLTLDHYYRYNELKMALEQWAKDYPELASLESIGKSYEGSTVITMQAR